MDLSFCQAFRFFHPEVYEKFSQSAEDPENTKTDPDIKLVCYYWKNLCSKIKLKQVTTIMLGKTNLLKQQVQFLLEAEFQQYRALILL